MKQLKVFLNISKSNALTVLSIYVTILICLFALLSCSGDSGGNGGSTPASTKPTNLVISAAVVGATTQNPNGDGSGMVKFSLNATNATSYKITFGNGDSKDVTDGNVSYTYLASGTNTYTIYVSAYNLSNFISTSTSFTIYVAPTTVWSDEFNVDGAPDPTKWTFQLWDPGRVNNELQTYTNRPENAIVEGGVLKIKAIREKYGKGDFTSSRLESNGKFDFTYGKIVIRAKLPTGVGTWPAVWMLGSNIATSPWPACGEIDMLESVGKNPNQNHSSLHSPGRSGNTPDTGIVKVPNDNTEFHIYTTDWRADYIKFSVDDQVYYTFANSDKFPFNKNFYLIVNLAMGGLWGGPVDPNFTSSTFEVDYIRVYN